MAGLGCTVGKTELSDEDGSIDESVNKLNIIAENIEKKKDDDIRYSFQIERECG